jgi:hypothetical protein
MSILDEHVNKCLTLSAYTGRFFYTWRWPSDSGLLPFRYSFRGMAEAGGVAQGGADGTKVGCGPCLPERLLSARVGAFRMGCRRLLAGAGEMET